MGTGGEGDGVSRTAKVTLAVVGAVMLLVGCIVTAFVVYCCFKKKKRSQAEQTGPGPAKETGCPYPHSSEQDSSSSQHKNQPLLLLSSA